MILDTIFEDEDLSVKFLQGSSNMAVISFGSIPKGGKADINRNSTEFKKALESMAEDVRPSALFVMDKNVSWFNNCSQKAVSLINSVIESRGFNHVRTLGYSMGGYAALALAPQIKKLDRVVAIVPQNSLNPEIEPYDNRWISNLSNVRAWTLPPISEVPRHADTILFVGGLDDLDVGHIFQMASRPGENPQIVFVVSAGTHGLGDQLKTVGILHEIICKSLISDDMQDIADIMDKAKISFEMLCI